MDKNDKLLDEYIINILYLLSEYQSNIKTSQELLNKIKELNSLSLFQYISRNDKITANELLSYFM